MQLKLILFQAVGWFKSSIILFVNTVKNSRSRKTVLFFGVLVSVFLYLSSSYLLPAHRHFHASQVQSNRASASSCLDSFTHEWNNVMAANDGVYKEIPGSALENRFLPFVGNGYVGLSVDSDNSKYYAFINKEAIEIPVLPVITPSLVETWTKKEQAVLLHLKTGVVKMLTSYIVNKTCVVVEELFFAHRMHKDLFFHEINIKNQGQLPVTFKFKQISNKQIVTSKQKVKTKHGTMVDYNLNYGAINHPLDSNKKIKVSHVLSDFPQSIRVPQKSQNKVSTRSITKFEVVEKPKKDKRERKSTKKAAKDSLSQSVSNQLLDVLDIPADTLQKQHVDAWSDIWKVGVRIASETDPDSPSSLHVNLTEYYMYSTLMYNRSKPSTKMMDCFSGAPTIHEAQLWVVPSSIQILQKLLNTWYSIFTRSGCIKKETSDLLTVREAMVLSFLGLQYQKYHLQLALNPINLRSNISVRSVSLERFHSQDLLDLDIMVDKKQLDRVLHVTCVGNHKPIIYGCSTACEDVVQLGSSTLYFPVHTTDPVTPIFYISTNRTDLKRIGQTDFMRSAKQNAKNAHQSHLVVHHLKLSPKFWLAVIILIVSFHLIVIKMIYNECRNNRGSGRRRGPFNS